MHYTHKRFLPLLAIVLSLSLLITGFAKSDKAPPFFNEQTALDALVTLPPPPASDSVTQERDYIAFYQGRSLIKTPRWEQAIQDSDWSKIEANFSQAFGTVISPKTTPALHDLIQRWVSETKQTAKPIKNHYKRIRPFMVLGQEVCTPQNKKRLEKSGSYPSAHSAAGWGLALILTEIRPQNFRALYQRGRDFGDSRIICGAHWQSDVETGRLLATQLLSYLHSNQEFLTMLEAAKHETATQAK